MSEEHVLPFRRAGAREVPGQAPAQASEQAPPAPDDEEQLAGQLVALFPALASWATTLVATDEVDDVVQDALMRFWRRRQRGTVASVLGTSELRSTLFGLVASVAQERHRLDGNRNKLLMRLVAGRTADHVVHRSNPFISGVRGWMQSARRAEQAQVDPRIVQALGLCSPTQLQLVTLVHRHGLTIHEAAAALQLSASGARAHLTRAHARMRQLLESTGMHASHGGSR